MEQEHQFRDASSVPKPLRKVCLWIGIRIPKSWMCEPSVRFCERSGGAIPRAYSTYAECVGGVGPDTARHRSLNDRGARQCARSGFIEPPGLSWRDRKKNDERAAHPAPLSPARTGVLLADGEHWRRGDENLCHTGVGFALTTVSQHGQKDAKPSGMTGCGLRD